MEFDEMKIVMLGPYTIGDRFAGGVERHIKNISQELGKMEDIEMHVISLSGDVDKDCIVEDGNVTVHLINKSFVPMTISGLFLYPYKIIKETKKIDPDFVHGQMLGAPYGLATALLTKIFQTILTIHTVPSEDALFKTKSIYSTFHDFIWKKLERFEFKNIDHFISISNYNVKIISNFIAKEVHVIPNGIDSKWFNIEKDIVAGRLLFVGRILPVKGLTFLLNGLSKIIDTNKSIDLHIAGPIGDKIYFNGLLELIEDLNLKSSVKFMGALDDSQLAKEYRECELFILPSKRETQGIVLLEAIASGTTIVTTNVGGIPEIIKNGYNGFLVEHDDIKSLADRIISLLSKESVVENLNVCDNNIYSWNEIAVITRDLYLDIL